MASMGSLMASGLCFFVFFIARRFAFGLAAPALLAIGLACVALWSCILRVPDLKRVQVDETEQEQLRALRAACAGAATNKASKPTVASETGNVSEHQDEDACEVSGEGGGAEAAGDTDGAGATHHGQSVDTEETGLEKGERCPPKSEAAGTRKRRDHDESSSDGDDGHLAVEEENVHDPERAKELRLEGNEHFKANRLHDAREAYSEAIYIMPEEEAKDKEEKAVLYANRAACNQKLERWEETAADCKLAIELDPTYLKAWLRRSSAFEKLERWHDAAEDLKKAIELDESLRGKEARRLAILEERAKVQFEKDKEEMMGKLKDLGNMVLGKFGMSVDNFKLEQDPNTGSYSIKYQT
mmetsp:Transcript_37991/g.88763  ORF Transcript_37991/g.88763 Transcript_37991/m.88763 type:complete len:356 (+) Transcript_37991:99-1166(+)